jgi:ArsR family transcriptional regulator, nickel/cobalt-responsive transcriptional repressor
VPHPLEHSAPQRPLDREEAEQLAAAMRAFGAASRVQLLWALMDGERTVEQLEEATGLSQTLVSHQLRILRDLQLVAVRRSGRHGYYSLHDHHLPDLLAAIRNHREHVQDAELRAAGAAAPTTAS